jgi:thiol-disulfide isomerase/thioredoxin
LSNQSTSDGQVLKAPKFEVKHWVDANGRKKEAVSLSDFNGRFKVLFCFQSWCPGCHSRGLPTLQKMVEALKENDKVAFLAIQTVFEGYEANTFEKMVETQKQYNLKIPFGHDAGNDDKSTSNIMKNYRTGGTPWFIFIDMNDNIVFADFHLNENAAIAFLKSI